MTSQGSVGINLSDSPQRGVFELVILSKAKAAAMVDFDL